MLAYTCQEAAQFYNEKTEIEMNDEDAFKMMVNQLELKDDLYKIENLENVKNLQVKYIHK